MTPAPTGEARWVGELRNLVGAPAGVVVDVDGGAGEVLDLPDAVVTTASTRALVASPSCPPTLVSAPAGLPLADSCADLVLAVGTLEDAATPRAVVAELARVTRGRCVVAVPWQPWHRLAQTARGQNPARLGRDPEAERSFAPKGLARTLGRGFRDVELRTVAPWLLAVCRGAKVGRPR